MKSELRKTVALATGAKYYIVGREKAYGPFETADDAENWASGRPSLGETKLWSFYQPASEGTAEKAHECGTALRQVVVW